MEIQGQPLKTGFTVVENCTSTKYVQHKTDKTEYTDRYETEGVEKLM